MAATIAMPSVEAQSQPVPAPRAGGGTGPNGDATETIGGGGSGSRGNGATSARGEAVSTAAATRKPLSAFRLAGSLRYRAADRANFASRDHDPPRRTRRGLSPPGRVRSGSSTGPGS